VIILEEASFIDRHLFFTVCVPLMGVAHTAVLAISTPDEEMNYYSELFEMADPDTGKRVFYSIKIGLACDACLEKGAQCNHLMNKLPHWKPVERQALISKILASEPDLADREIRGVVKSSATRLFERQWILALQDRAPYVFEHSPSVIWTSIDPHGGGNKSNFGIGSLAYENARHVVTYHHHHHPHNNTYTDRIVCTNTPSCRTTCLSVSSYSVPFALRPAEKNTNPRVRMLKNLENRARCSV
jgi:hypothetical protein